MLGVTPGCLGVTPSIAYFDVPSVKRDPIALD